MLIEALTTFTSNVGMFFYGFATFVLEHSLHFDKL
jgi:hypothetical protein